VDYRLAAIDLDGTLLRSDGTISARSHRAVRNALAAGMRIVIVTARGPRTVREFADELGIEGDVICSNGALVVDLATGEPRRSRLLQSEVAIRLVHGLRERLPGVLFAVEREAFAQEPGFSAWEWAPPPDTRIADALELLEQPTAKLIIRHDQHESEVIASAARELAGDEAAVTVPGIWTVEVSAAGVNKAAALAELCDEFGVSAEEVVAFGDYLNDLPMLAWAGRAVAVANAHPELVDVADEVTASNDEDGVALVLERLSA
jgi:Cof subfamily protein (haloacid dehalogenase superfamily)